MTLEQFAKQRGLPLFIQKIERSTTFRCNGHKIDKKYEKKWTFEIRSPLIAHSLYYERNPKPKSGCTGGSVSNGHDKTRKEARENLLKHIRGVTLYSGTGRSLTAEVPPDLQ